MTHPKCALCDEEITKENDTNEHLIPNKNGGSSLAITLNAYYSINERAF